MAHRLTGGILRDHLRRVGGAFARAFESDFARARPADHVAVQIGDRDDRVVESGENMGDAGVNVLAALGLDDLRLLNVIRVRAKDFLSALRRLALRLSSFAGFFSCAALARFCSGAQRFVPAAAGGFGFSRGAGCRLFAAVSASPASSFALAAFFESFSAIVFNR